jgi:hypothetical protein
MKGLPNFACLITHAFGVVACLGAGGGERAMKSVGQGCVGLGIREKVWEPREVPYLVAMHPSSLVLRPASPHCRTGFGS